MVAENQRNGLKVIGPFMTLCYDSDYREKDPPIECAATITGSISLADPAMEVRTLPGGTFLTLLSRGPYPGLDGEWTWIGAYAEEPMYIPAGPHREVTSVIPTRLQKRSSSPSSRSRSPHNPPDPWI